MSLNIIVTLEKGEQYVLLPGLQEGLEGEPHHLCNRPHRWLHC